ncbi:MAG: hypothetical protein QG616_2422 [Pseudomonadota bacterium]|jgi:hypothetical protein|nr:hypothetical protein [Pseudomonadota bacterium]
MQLPAPARECSDAEIDAVINYWDLRRQPQPLPTLDYMKQWSECCPYDDEPGPEHDRRSMGGLVLAIAASCVVIFGALALVLL